MDDLSTVSQSIQDIVSDGKEESITSAIERYLSSSSVDIRKTACESLLEVLIDNNSTKTEEEIEQSRETILGDTALTCIPLLLPLLPEQKDNIVQLVSLIASHSNARETMLALEERLQRIEERADGFVVSDDEGEFDQIIDWDVLGDELELILKSYAQVLPRLPNRKSTPTLLAISDALSSLLPLQAHHSTISSARSILLRGAALMSTAWTWVSTTIDAGGEQRAILTKLFFTFVALYAPRVDARLTERWFLSTFPKFARLSNRSNEKIDYSSADEALSQVQEVALQLKITTQDLLDKIVEPSLLSVHSSLAALGILAFSLLPTSYDEPKIALDGMLTPTCLVDNVRVLCAALSGSAVDAGVTWLWSLAHSFSQSQSIPLDDASMLVELLVPLTAQSPFPTMRLALFKLIGTLIDRANPSDKILLLKQLLEPSNPFDNVRLQSLTLLREQLSHLSTTNTLISPESSLANHLFPILFPNYCLPDEKEEDNPIQSSVEVLLQSPFPNWWIECLNILWFIIDLDQDDKIGLKSEYREGVEIWLWDIQGVYDRLKSESNVHGENQQERDHEMDGINFLLARWEDALLRAKNALA